MASFPNVNQLTQVQMQELNEHCGFRAAMATVGGKLSASSAPPSAHLSLDGVRCLRLIAVCSDPDEASCRTEPYSCIQAHRPLRRQK